MNLGDIPRRNARLLAGKPALVFEDGRRTFGGLDDRVNRLAQSLDRGGVGAGRRAAILSHNGPEFVETYYALAKLGAVAVPINYRLHASEIAYQVLDAGAEIVFFGPSQSDVSASVRAAAPGRRWVAYREAPPWAEAYESLVAAAADDPDVAVADDATAMILYTSGTTGRPKGVELTHRNWISNCYHTSIALGLGEDDVFLGATPMFHSSGAGRVFSSHFAGATYTGLPQFEPAAVLDAVSRWGVTQMVAVPTMIRMLVEALEARTPPGLDSLRILYYGGSPVDLEVLTAAMRLLPCAFAQGYALTEASLMVTYLSPGDHRRAVSDPAARPRLGSAGRPVPGVLVALGRDGAVWDVPDRPGEILVRGPNVMRGYWNQREATEEALAGGWLHTGDVGRLDADGYLYVMDRVKDMIISGGENIYPKEIEQVLLDHPAVAEAAVIGVPDEFWGESVRAFVVPRPALAVTADELIRHCADRLARYKKPRVVDVVAALPKTSLGKVAKHELRRPFWSGRDRKI